MSTDKPKNRFNARVCSSRRACDLSSEMEKIGPEPYGITRMIKKAVHYVIKLHGVRTPAALILKEDMLSKGGDCTIHRDAITNRVERCDCLLMGTEKAFSLLTADLRLQPFGLARMADEIEQAILSYECAVPVTPPDGELPDNLIGFYKALRERTLIMGILNVTTDSFSDGGLYADLDKAVARAVQMIGDGADVIDVGGESTRPGSEPVSVNEEIKRVVPVIKAISEKLNIPISIDTYKPLVASAAIEAGACIINDITGFAEQEMRELAAEKKIPSIIMHIKGTPKTMQVNPVYDNLISEISSYLRERAGMLEEDGLPPEYIIIDPGIGFGKTVEHNLEIIRNLADFKSLGYPILIGPSRKAFIGQAIGGLPSSERIEGTSAVAALSIANGAKILRVHDVKQIKRAALMTDAVQSSSVCGRT